MTGQTIGHYRILEQLGAGGMGIVYKALDTHLDRFVAIKVLPPEKVADAERNRRFVQEAKTASALNHPNIVHIYDIAEAEGVQYIAMEYVPGKTLDQVMGRKGLRLNECLKYAIQIADALAKAHAAGIIHRDLKPSNVMVSENGLIKVLDFGLAKLVETTGEFAETATLRSKDGSNTQEGVIVGTTAYVSPEQAEAHQVDARSDIFSFGSVLYEMVTGRRAFQGNSRLSTLSAILKDEPKLVSTILADAPRDLEKIVSRCLRKDPNRRFQHMLDVKVALEELEEESESGKLPGSAAGAKTSIRSQRWLMISGSLTVIAVITTAAFLLLRRNERSRGELIPVRITSNPPDSPIDSFSLSPDGKYLLYADASGVHLRAIHTADSRLIPDTKGMVVPAWGWSSDGTRIVLERHGASHPDFYSVSVLGGVWRPLGNSLPLPYGRHTLILSIVGFQLRAEDGTVYPLAQDGGRPVTEGSANRRFFAVAFTRPEGSCWIEAFDLERRRWTRLVPPQRQEIIDVAWLSESRLIYAQSDANLWVLDVNPTTGLPSGLPRRRTQGWELGIGNISASADGSRLCMLRGNEQHNLYVGALRANGATLAEPRRLTAEDADDRVWAWTPDSRAVLFTSNRNGSDQIFKQEIDKDTAEPIASGPGTLDFAHVSPDGQWLLFVSHDQTQGRPRARVLRMPLLGGEAQEVLASDAIDFLQCSRIPGGACELGETAGNVSKVSLLDPVKGRGAEVLETRLDAGGLPRALDMGSAHGSISPDGRHVALILPGVTHNRIRIVGLNGVPETDITVSGAEYLMSLDWSADGSGFYCGEFTAANSSRLLHVQRDGAFHVLWSIPGQRRLWGIPSPDARYLATGKETESANVWMVENP